MKVHTDSRSNRYITGRLKGTGVFGTSPVQLSTTNYGDRDLYLVKYDSIGTALWARRFGTPGSDYGYSICTDTSLNVYIGGYFTGGNVPMYGDTVYGQGSSDGIIAKFDASGNHIWSIGIGGSGIDAIYAIECAGNQIFASGTFSDTLIFGHDTIVSAGDLDVFVAVFDLNGNCRKLKRFGGTLEDHVNDMAIDSANLDIYLGGYFMGTTNFDGSLATSSGLRDGFVVKLDSTISVQFFSHFKSLQSEEVTGIDVFDSSKIAVSGVFRYSFLYPNSSGGTTSFARTSGLGDFFVAELNAFGNVRYITGGGSSTTVDDANDVEYNKWGNPVVCGVFKGAGTFGTVPTNPIGTNDVFVAEFNETGNPLWFRRFKGNPGSGGIDSRFYGVAIGAGGFIDVTGRFVGNNVVFDSILVNATTGTSDIVTIRLSPYMETEPELPEIVLCQNDSMQIRILDRRSACSAIQILHPFSTANRESDTSFVSQFLNTSNILNDSLVYVEINAFEQDTVYIDDYFKIRPLPSVEISGSEFVCPNSVSTYSVENFFNILWSTGDTNDTINLNSAGIISVEVMDTNGCRNSDTIFISEYLPINAIVSPFETVCFGDSVLVELNGYESVLWSDGDTSLSKFIYEGFLHMVGTDSNSCVYHDSITVTSYPAVNPIYDENLVLCQGDSIMLFAVGMQSVVWNSGQSVFSNSVNQSGLYWLNGIDTNGCSISDSVLVSDVIQPVLFNSADTILCFGDSVFYHFPGFAFYSWNDVLNVDQFWASFPGQLNLNVIDSSGCSFADSILVTYHPLDNPIVFIDSIICPSDSILIDLPNYSQIYWNGINSSSLTYFNIPSNYILQAIDQNGCYVEDTFLLSHFVQPEIIFFQDTLICQGSVVEITANGFSNYLWSNGQSTPSIFTDSSGIFSVNVLDENGCGWSDSAEVMVSSCDDVNELSSKPQILAYPNPFEDNLFFTSETKVFRIEVFDFSGRRLIYNTKLDSGINTTELEKGVYLFAVFFEDGNFVVLKLEKM